MLNTTKLPGLNVFLIRGLCNSKPLFLKHAKYPCGVFYDTFLKKGLHKAILSCVLLMKLLLIGTVPVIEVSLIYTKLA